MTIRTVDRVEFENSPGRLLDFVSEGNEVVIVDGAHTRARLVGTTKARRSPGLHRGTVWIADDFDSPLPDEFWLGERP